MMASQEYKTRRRDLAMRIPPYCIAIIPAATERLRNGDAHYRFRQDSDFYYLTGFNEPDSLLLVTSGKEHTSVLFNRPNNPVEEQWSGQRLGQDGACQILGVDAAYPLSDIQTRLPELLANKQAIYYAIGEHPAWEDPILKAWQTVKGMSRRGVNAPDAFCDLSTILGDMRLIKSDTEIALMQQAGRITVVAHQRAIKACRKARYEYELEAELTYEFTRQGCRSVAYDSIVASGRNACILHYTNNNQPLNAGDLVLIDAGAEFENYAADVTRTFPINGRFSTEQRLIYELVLRAQRAGIDCIKPGCLWPDIQQTIVKILTEGLISLGLLRGQLDELITQEAYKPFYMHNSGHWLGLDVHDSGRYKINGEWRRLAKNMMLTVEPGLYIPEGLDGIDERWWNIGVRIEDDIRVTDEGYENLTAGLVVEPDDIEALMNG